MGIASGVHTYWLWAGRWRPSFLGKGFGGACLGHLDDLHRRDAFAGHAVSGAQLVQGGLCHASPLLGVIQLVHRLPVASQGLVGLLLLRQRHGGKRCKPDCFCLNVHRYQLYTDAGESSRPGLLADSLLSLTPLFLSKMYSVAASVICGFRCQ